MEESKPSRILAYLYHPDELIRFKAAERLGEVCKGKKAKNYILRLFWLLNDESGSYCEAAPIAIAEIGRNNPEVFETFKNKYVSLLDDWEVERKYVAYGIGRLADIIADAYPDPVEKLREKIEELDANFAVYALWALKELGVRAKAPEKLLDEIVAFYDGNRIIRAPLRNVIKPW